MVTSWRENDGRDHIVREEVAGITVHWIPAPYDNTMGFSRRLRAFLSFAWQSSRLASSLPADIVFASSTPLTIAIPAVRAARRQGVPMVFEVRDLWPAAPIIIGALKNPALITVARMLERFAYRHSEQVVTLSPRMGKGVAATGYDPDRIHTIPNSCDLALFDPEKADRGWLARKLPELGDRTVLTFAGTVGKANGVDYIVEIAQHCLARYPQMAFVVVGGGNEAGHVRTLARTGRVLGKNFFMLPPVTKQEMPNILAGSGVALVISHRNPALYADAQNKFFDAPGRRKACCPEQRWLP